MSVQKYVVLLDALTYEHVVIEPPDTGPGMFDSDGD